MTFVKGQSGNPKGRPRAGFSLAEIVRREGRGAAREAVKRLWAIAADAHNDPHARIKAFAELRRAGWPNEEDRMLPPGRVTAVILELHRELPTLALPSGNGHAEE